VSECKRNSADHTANRRRVPVVGFTSGAFLASSPITSLKSHRSAGVHGSLYQRQNPAKIAQTTNVLWEL